MTTENTEGTELKITIKASSWTKMVRERDEALELVSELKRIGSDYCDEQLRLVFENRRLHQERDEARREVDRYREEKDLSPMSWDT